jgi:hypothetical protein
VILDLEAELAGTVDDRLVRVLVERDPEMVDARDVPVPRLEDDVDGSAGELDEAEPESDRVEILPGRARLEPLRALALPAVAADELEAELAEVPALEEADLARDQVVMEQMQRPNPTRRN